MIDPRAQLAIPHEGAGVLLTTDQIADIGGNERVLQSLLELCPRAEALSIDFAGTNVAPDEQPGWHERVRLVRMGGRRRGFLAPLYARRMRRARAGAARLIVSVVHGGWSAGLRAPAGARSLCYSAGLPPLLYGQTEDFLPEYPRPLWPVLRRSVPRLRTSYRDLMLRPDRLVVNSRYSAVSIERELGRKAEVVYPPVRTGFFTPAKNLAPTDAPFLLVARLMRQKRADIAVDAFRGLSERLVVVGDGPEGSRLRGSAPPNVSFTGPLGDEALRELHRTSRGFVCTSRETFGIAVCEALASGLPVIAPRIGGPAETVCHGETGLLLDRVEPQAVADAVRTLAKRDFDPAACRASAQRFSEERFQGAMAAILSEELDAASPVAA